MARTGKGRRPVTQYDIAAHLGVGQKTVSRALAGAALVSPALRARIEAAAAELGYRLNHSARSIKSRRFETIILLQVVAQRHHRTAHGIVDGLADGLAEAGRPLLIERLVLEDPTAPPPRALREAIADGLVVHVHAEPPPTVEAAIAARGLPTVWLNRPLAHDAVHPDDEGAPALMVARLVEAGHRRIVWLDGQVGHRPAAELHYSRMARIAGFRAAMSAAGLEPVVLSPRQDPHDDLGWIGTHLRSDRPTALACYGATEAMAALHAAGRIGLRIPEDCSLIAIHDQSLVAGPRIDTVLLPTEAMGRAAASMLVGQIASRRRAPSVRIPFTLRPGMTVAAPAR